MTVSDVAISVCRPIIKRLLKQRQDTLHLVVVAILRLINGHLRHVVTQHDTV